MQNLFWVVVYNTPVAAALALLAWIASRLRRPALAHVLWLLVIVKLLTPPIWRVPVHIQGSAGALVSAFVAPARETPAKQPSVGLPRAIAAFPPPAPLAATEKAIAPSEPIPWNTLLIAVWAAGSLAWAIVAALRVWRFRRVLQSSLAPDDGVSDDVNRLSRQVGLRGAPDVRIVEARLSPMICFLGLRRPMLVLP
ncbi:MAG: M56 family metallopeptidase, partial [Tepidisphaeraceae bacterium]